MIMQDSFLRYCCYSFAVSKVCLRNRRAMLRVSCQDCSILPSLHVTVSLLVFLAVPGLFSALSRLIGTIQSQV